MFVPWAGGEEPSPVPQGVGDFLFKACGRASKSLAFPTQLLAVPLGCPCPRSCLDTGFSFEISRNWGWSSSRGCRGSAQSLSMCVWRFLGWDFKAGFFLRLKPAHFRPSWGWINREGHSELLLPPPVDPLLCQVPKAGASAPGFSLFSQTEPPHLQADQAQLCRLFSAPSAWPFLHSGPRMPSRDVLGVLTVPAQALGWLRSPMRSRTCKHGVYSGGLNASSAAPPRMGLLVSSPNADGAQTPKPCPQAPI